MITLRKILSGEILQNEFLRKNLRYLILIFGLFFVLVIIGAIGDFKTAQIQELNSEIAELKENSVFISSELMHLSLVNVVNKEIQDRNIGLKKLSKPPRIIELKIEDNKKK
ncbi:MAG: hypothetical protein JXL97_14975 [Bacteroidales bacterium]|nr:hypothetical protein [Bacteroidales bacterium]